MGSFLEEIFIFLYRNVVKIKKNILINSMQLYIFIIILEDIYIKLGYLE